MFSKAETVEDVLNFRPFSRKKNEYYYDFGTGNKIPIKKTETALNGEVLLLRKKEKATGLTLKQGKDEIRI